MTMNKYIITLTPTGKFFLGGDMTFALGGEDNKRFDEQFSSYIIKSNYLPQQTSLLGLLRFYLLKNDEDSFDKNRMRIADEEKAAALIGRHSFNLSKEVDNEYGIIDSISPCFLQVLENGEWEMLHPAAFDRGMKVDWENAVCGTFNGESKRIPVLGNFDYKEGIRHGFVTSDDRFYELSDIFVEDPRLGINKDYSGKTQDAALYKQISYRFNNAGERQFRFVFSVNLTRELDLRKYTSDIVSMGADGSAFMLEIREGELPAVPSRSDRLSIQLFTDARIHPDALKESCFAISETLPFRNIESTVKTKNYGRFSKDMVRSQKRISLYRRGSVFYFENETAKKKFTDSVSGDEKFRVIGYNIFR